LQTLIFVRNSLVALAYLFMAPVVMHLLSFRQLGLGLSLPLLIASVTGVNWNPATAQSSRSSLSQPGGAMTIRSDVQEANAKTGVVTARGNVQINYPSRQIQATAAQAQYYSRERRIILTGNVYVLQSGNSLRGEVITYLMDEGRFVATPRTTQQVESIYLVPDAAPAAPAPIEPQMAAPPPAAPLKPLSLPSLNPSTAPPQPQISN
jgi:lipopolysaccharide export system protein LptA